MQLLGGCENIRKIGLNIMKLNESMVRTGGMASGMLGLLAMFWFGMNYMNNQSNLVFDQLHNVSVATSVHQQADMMHDGIRGDVLQALLSVEHEDGKMLNEAVAALGEHGTEFRNALTTNEKANLPPELKQGIAGLRQPLDEYIGSAQKIMDTAKERGAEANAMLPGFLQAFEKLEGEQAQVTDLLNKYGENALNKANKQQNTVMLETLGVIVVLGALCAVFLMYDYRSQEKSRETGAKIEAISKSQAVIEFKPDGTILDANANFIGAVGYKLSEIIGRHHKMFVEPGYGNSEEYRKFWATLRSGQFQSGEFQRFGREGKEIWIQASYNPVFDAAGKVYKVVKFASDTTAQVQLRKASERIKSAVQETISTVSTSVIQTQGVVQNVAHGAAELNSSVSDIVRNMGVSKEAVGNVVEQSQAASAAVATLADASQSMNKVVELIDAIASQISMLALNAAIEAARAGEAGRGFAVVSDEVKKLAAQTTAATAEIGSEISRMQSISERVVAALDGISTSVTSVSDSINSVASATEQQSSVSQGISRSMAEVEASVKAINNSIVEIARETGAMDLAAA